MKTLFKSEAALKILKSMKRDEKNYQSEIIKKLNFSNKTIINQLKKMVKMGILEEYEEKIVKEGTAYWVKWYKLTDVGKWLHYFLINEKEIDKKEFRKILDELTFFYSIGLKYFCKNFRIPLERFYENIEYSWIKDSLDKEKNKEAEIIVFGTNSVDFILHFNKIGNERFYSENLEIRPGGAGANIAVFLSKLGLKTALATKIGIDNFTRFLIEDLLKRKVICRNIIIDRKLKNPISIIFLSKNGNKKIIYTNGKDRALSITPEEIDWNLIKKAKAIVICESYIEVAKELINYCLKNNLRIFYRPSYPQIVTNIEKIIELCKNIDALILGEEEEKEIINKGYDIKQLCKNTIITHGEKECIIYENEEKYLMKPLEIKIKEDLCGKDAFTAGFISAFLEGKNIKESVFQGLCAAAITISRGGCREGVPNKEELIEFLKKVNFK
jgi:sugar/nucleoside kinase (ribokinase family)/DNA-binding HxlR family transcriptional regulator